MNGTAHRLVWGCCEIEKRMAMLDDLLEELNRKDELIAATQQELEAERSAKNAFIRRLHASGLFAAEIAAIAAMDENEVKKALKA